MMNQNEILNQINKINDLRAFASKHNDVNSLIRYSLAISILKDDLIRLLLIKAA